MKVFKLECRTGCSCCSYENHYRGLYETREEIEARKKRFSSGVDNPLASQYSKYGCYSIEEYEAEEISNNRIIVEDKVYEKKFIKVNIDDGSLIDSKDDYLESD